MKKLFHFIKKNYFLLTFASIIFFVSLLSVYRIYVVKPTYIYVKVKLGQGLWWASTSQPPLWIINSITKDKKENQTIAQIIKVNYYPYFTTGINNQFIDQFDVYLYLRLKVTKNNKSFYFNRSVITVGTPIDLEFLNTQISGTVISLSDKPLIDKYINKIVFLIKKDPFLWEYEAIKIGDYYFDGENKVFEIVDKEMSENEDVLTVKAKIKVKEINNQLIFANEKFFNIGKNINIITNNFNFNNYIISKID